MTTTVQSIDLSYLEMMADGDDMMKKTMLDMLIEEMPPELEKLRQAYLTRDTNELRQVAHKMKSTLAFVGNDPMTHANAELEEIAIGGEDLQRAVPHLEILEASAKVVMPLLRAESAKL